MFLPPNYPQKSRRHRTTCREHHHYKTPPSSTSSSGPHHEHVAGPRCTAVASCSIGGCDPPSVITASLFRCAVHAWCGVSRVWRAAKNNNYGFLVYGQMVTMADFRFDGVSSSLAEVMSIFFSNVFFNCFFVLLRYYARNPDTTDYRQHIRAVQDACYTQLATTLYTLAACQQSRKQHHTRAVVCPRCNTVASYLVAFVTLRSVCDACCHRYYTDISHRPNMISYEVCV